MTYYFMTETEINEYYAINTRELRTIAHQKVVDEHKGYDVCLQMWSNISAHSKSIIKKHYLEAEQEATDYLAKLPTAMGKTKAIVIAEACRFFDRHGIVEGWIEGIAWDTYTFNYHTSQSWYVFKKDGQWFFQMKKGQKTVHKVEVE